MTSDNNVNPDFKTQMRTRQEAFGTIIYNKAQDTFALESSWPVNEILMQPLSAPLTLHWITTLKCNARCPYCYELPSLLKKTDNEKILSPEECARFINDYASAGGFRLYLTGGEPTMHPFLPEIIRLGHEQGLSSVVNTNGITMPEDIYASMKKYKARLSVSLDSDVADIHETVRKQHSYDSLVALIERAACDDIPVRVITVLSEKNSEGMLRMGEYLQRLGAQSWFLQPLTGECASSDIEKELRGKLPGMRVRVLPAIYDSFFYLLPDGSTGRSLWNKEREIYGKVQDNPIKELWYKHPTRFVKDQTGLLRIFDMPSREYLGAETKDKQTEK